jgi:hypothetical protein
MKEKTAEQKKFEEFYLLEQFYEEDIEPCVYDLDNGEGCVNQSLKNIDSCCECWLYQQAVEEQEKEEEKAKP